MNLLEGLYTDCGTSPWLDSVRRSYLRSGRFDHLVKRGIRGAIGYPSLFEHVVWGSSEYDAQIIALTKRHLGAEEIYWELIISDVTAALACLAPVYEVSGGHDGFVVFDLPPTLAHDTTGTITTARSLRGQIGRPNLLVRIPGTGTGICAMRRLVADGMSVAVDVLDVRRYEEVADGYLSGLEICPGDLSGVHGLAAFDLGRLVATYRGVPEGGGADLSTTPDDAVTLARSAYGTFRTCFSGPRWERLARRGATVQRPLWFPPPAGPGRSSAALVQSLAGRDCVVAVSDDMAVPERPVAPPARHGSIGEPADALTANTVGCAGDESLTGAQEESALGPARRAYAAVLAALEGRVSSSG